MPTDSTAHLRSSPDPAIGRRLPLGVAVAGTVLVGVLTAVQARINGSLGDALDDAFASGVVSFGSGLLILLALSLILPAGRAGLLRFFARFRAGEVPWWMMTGGLCGAFTVVTQGVTVATIGVALFTVGIVAGQTLHGLVLDRVGFGPGGVVPVTILRVAGAALAIAAVAICIAGGPSTTAWWMLLLPLAAGAGVAWQQAMNGRLRQRIDSALTATLVNFAAGTVALVLAAVLNAVLTEAPEPLPPDPWIYLGGAVGVVYIFISAAIVRRTGVLLLGLGSVVGLLATSVLLDVVWPAPSGPSLSASLVAVVVALVGVSVAVLRWPRRGSARAPALPELPDRPTT